MDEVYGGGSVLSYTKVPCTPVTGAFANYFDVFGDVEQQRIGTGSSIASTASSASSCGGEDGADELPPIISEKKPPSALFNAKISSALSYSPFLCRNCNKRLGSSKTGSNRSKSSISDKSNNGNSDSFEMASALQRDPYIVFLQEKQVEILGALHQEIRMLKHENTELKFQIHVVLREQSPDGAAVQRLCAYREKVNTPNMSDNDNSSSIEMTVSGSGNREKMLELELESATKMIQELKWVQQHYENKIRMQETKMDDLMRQLNINNSVSSENMKAWPIQIQTPTVGQATKATNTTTRALKSGRQRSSSVVHHAEPMNRRNSLQSILPDDYKQQVATLPPILATNPTNAMRIPNVLYSPNNANATSNKQYEATISKSNRRSSLISSNTGPSSVARINNGNKTSPAAFCTEESSK